MDDKPFINLDELYETKQKKDIEKLKNFNKILYSVHNKIKIISRQKNEVKYCVYIIPNIILGVKKYNIKECATYIIQSLRDNGFNCVFYNPNIIFISWEHYIPRYIRTQIKNNTGILIDENGNKIHEKTHNTQHKNRVNFVDDNRKNINSIYGDKINFISNR